ncbi:P-loop containing nucleoside triphosphate hydrolase protein [Suillus hirtellus]|nr:P-loop containing nucleoside triphosphate hydrolase protein [Suillus hirtellus]
MVYFLWFSVLCNLYFPGIARKRGSQILSLGRNNDERDFVCMRGLKRLVNDTSHRQELVAGNLSEHISARFREASRHIGHDAAKTISFFHGLSQHHVYYPTNNACATSDRLRLTRSKKPMTTPLSLASFLFIKQAFNLSSNTDSSTPKMLSAHAYRLSRVREVYETENIRNEVVDGTEPFPENQQSLANGISVEFRNVSFQYPGRDRSALRNVSFKIEAGHLCVVVGVNGSGKSTILKLISRIYDPTGGTILINNRHIKTLKLADLRAAMSMLFQDYSQFPLSVSHTRASRKRNI